MGLLRDAVVFSVVGLATPGMTSAALAQTPQSQCSVLSGIPCHPSFCGVFHRGPCLPYYLPPLGEDLRLTIVSSDDTDRADNNAAKNDQAGEQSGGENATASMSRIESSEWSLAVAFSPPD